jgi:hypothetical protein
VLATQELRDKDHLLSYLNEAYSGARSKPAKFKSLHVFLLSIHKSFTLQDVVSRARHKGLPVSIVKKGTDLYLLSVGVRTSHQVGFLIPLDGYWAFFSDGGTAELASTLGAFARAMYPALKLVYLPSPDLLDFVGAVAHKYRGLVVTEGTIWSGNQTSRTWKKEHERFVRSRMERVAKEQRGKWSGISFRCSEGAQDLLSCRVHETGNLTLYSGDFNRFYEDALLPYLAVADRLSRQLAGKERVADDGRVKLSPIPYHLPSRITAVEMELLKGQIIKHYASAVMHSGNPMLMMQVTDSADGSAYDLYAYGQDVRIVPLQHASEASLSGLVALLSDTLPMGALAGT